MLEKHTAQRDSLEKQGVQTEPGHGCGNNLTEEDDAGRTKQFAQVRAGKGGISSRAACPLHPSHASPANHDLGQGAAAEDCLGKHLQQTILEVPVAVQSERVPWMGKLESATSHRRPAARQHTRNKPHKAPVCEAEPPAIVEGLCKAAQCRRKARPHLALCAGTLRRRGYRAERHRREGPSSKFNRFIEKLVAFTGAKDVQKPPGQCGRGEENGGEKGRVIVAKLSGRGPGQLRNPTRLACDTPCR